VAARSAGLEPFLLVNKCDLDGSAEFLAELTRLYSGSVPIFPISVVRRSGFAPLEEYFSHGHRGAFVGTTGVGKSSLLNVLCPDIDLKVGSVSLYKSMGRHTTTVSTLHALAGGGELVDTPGFRDFGLVDSTIEELAEYYPGFEAHQDVACKFRNCRHRSEPGCAVLTLVDQGRIPAERYATYMEILGEVENLQEAARSRDWKNK
jgi:ribosome biogenesis GTPase